MADSSSLVQDILIPEFLIALFYLLFLLRSPVQRLQSLEGLLWLPLIALLVTLGLFPAYGFRPEVIPLLLYGIAFNLPNLPTLGVGRQNPNLFIRGPVFTLINTILLTAVMIPAFVFAPTGDRALSPSQTLTIRDEGRGRDYFLRIYGADRNGSENRPLLFIVPPPTGSVGVIDELCGDLERRGFTVLTYSRRGFDSPAVGEQGRLYPVSPVELCRRLVLLFGASRLKSINDTARALEDGRKQDVEFLLPHIRRLPASAGRPLFLAGYGTGGSALIYLAGSPGFKARNPDVRGIMTVESLLWSAYREQEIPVEASFEDTRPLIGQLRRLGAQAGHWLSSLGPKRMTSPEPVPSPELPLLVILSSRSLDPNHRASSYTAILNLMLRLREPGLLVAAEGAGPLDYTAYFRQYPLLSLLFPGKGQRVWNGGNYTGGTVSLMTGFASQVLGNEGPGIFLVPGTVPAQGLRVERRAWNLVEPRYIVNP